jgi:hypothetical protein
VAESDTCEVESYAFSVQGSTDTGDYHNALCSDFSDDLIHMQDMRLRDYAPMSDPDYEPQDEQCGRGTQAGVCRQVAETTMEIRSSVLTGTEDQFSEDQHWSSDIPFLLTDSEENLEGTHAHNNYRYRDKATYVNPNLAGQGSCVSPNNLVNNNGQLVRPAIWQRAIGSVGITTADPIDLVQEHVMWFDGGNGDLDENLRLWPKHVCSDGGEGSVRIPFHFGGWTDSDSGYPNPGNLFFMDFGCPYGSQPEACPPREGLEEYQQTFDEIEQPTGPEFSNCFDDNVPDFECCRATNEFRIHGGGGLVGNDGGEDLQYCAYPDVVNDFGLPNERKYDRMNKLPNVDSDYGDLATVADGVQVVYKRELPESCMARCDADVDCGSFVYYEDGLQEEGESDKKWCKFYVHDATAYLTDGAKVLGTVEVSPTDTTRLLAVTDDASDQVYERSDKGDECGLHWTSYHHASTGCKAFCRAAFQRDGDDNTCMPAKPECANWLNANDFPKAQYVTVDAECICGAKLEEFQTAGKYVNTGTVLSRARARARQLQGGGSGTTATTATNTTTTTRYGESWEWPDAVPSGIDQFHGKTLLTSLERTRAHMHTCTQAHKHTRTRTRTHALAYSRTRFACRRAL